MKKFVVALLVAMLALIATVALADTHTHAWTKEYTVDATCQGAGFIHWSCTCGEEFDETIAKKEHDYVYAGTIAATCQNKGYDLWYCSMCDGELKNAWVDVKNCWDEAKVDEVAATCTTKGHLIITCKWCGDLLWNEEYKALGHDPYESKGYTESGEDTCTTDLIRTWKCERCGQYFNETINNVKKHAFGDWTVTTKPTCIVDGVETRTCVNAKCPEKETRPVAAKGHKIVETSIKTNDKGVVIGYCTVCEKWVPVDEKPVVKPEETQKPEEKPTEKPEDKPTTKPTTKPSTPNKPTTNNSGVTIPATGETMNVAPFIMMLVAIVGLAVTKQKVTE